MKSFLKVHKELCCGVYPSAAIYLVIGSLIFLWVNIFGGDSVLNIEQQTIDRLFKLTLGCFAGGVVVSWFLWDNYTILKSLGVSLPILGIIVFVVSLWTASYPLFILGQCVFLGLGSGVLFVFPLLVLTKEYPNRKSLIIVGVIGSTISGYLVTLVVSKVLFSSMNVVSVMYIGALIIFLTILWSMTAITKKVKRNEK